MQLLAYLLRKISNLLRIKISTEDRKQQAVVIFEKTIKSMCVIFNNFYIKW